MKIKNQYTSYSHITKEFEIETDSGETIRICKWWVSDDVSNDYDNDYEINEDDKKNIVEKMDEDEQDRLVDFINEELK